MFIKIRTKDILDNLILNGTSGILRETSTKKKYDFI